MRDPAAQISGGFLQQVLRNLKIIGFFTRLAIRDNKNLNCYFEDRVIGQLTSAIYSPKFKTNLAFMIAYEDDVLNENRNYLVKTKKDFVEAKIKRID